MTKQTATKKDAAQTSDEAGAPPPFDARCVTVAVGSLPPQSRAARDPFSRVPEPETSGMRYHSVAAVQPLRSFAKQFGLGFHPETEAFAAIPMLEEASEWAVPVKKVASHKRLSVRFSFLEGLLVYGGEFTFTFPSGLVKPVRAQILAACLKVASMDVRGPKVPGLVNKRGSKTMEAQIRPGA